MVDQGFTEFTLAEFYPVWRAMEQEYNHAKHIKYKPYYDKYWRVYQAIPSVKAHKKEYRHEYYLKHREEEIAKSKKYVADHKELRREYKRRWREKKKQA